MPFGFWLRQGSMCGQFLPDAIFLGYQTFFCYFLCIFQNHDDNRNGLRQVFKGDGK